MIIVLIPPIKTAKTMPVRLGDKAEPPRDRLSPIEDRCPPDIRWRPHIPQE